LRAGLLLPGLMVDKSASADVLDNAECIVPAKVGGGFDLTCKLVGNLIAQRSGPARSLRVTYLPGGIGAVAFDRMVTQRLPNMHALVAFSGGSLLNLAQGKFGPHQASDVRWVAAVGTDYGAIAVPKDSPIRNLEDLKRQLQGDLARVVFGAGGTVGSQDWVKAALIVKAAGLDHKGMRFVSFEGGGEALCKASMSTAFPGDAAEALQAMAGGAAVRLLAVLSAQRLGGALTGVPTAREQGVDLVWPTVRGLYLSADVPEPAVRAWANAFREASAAPGFAALREQHGLYPFALTGAALDDYVQAQIKGYQQLADELGLRRWKP
jgi:putative tricarboxylic transport membrane protein